MNPIEQAERFDALKLVERWFGAGFDTLHPLLRALHRRGGELQGTVYIR